MSRVHSLAHSIKGLFGMMEVDEIYEPSNAINLESKKKKCDTQIIINNLNVLKNIINQIPEEFFPADNADKQHIIENSGSETKNSEFSKKYFDVLLVDDNMNNRRLFTILLEKLDLSVDTAENGRIALDKLSFNEFGLVLLDMQMPVMDGFGTIKNIRSDVKLQKLPVIALTAMALKGDEKKILDAGCDGYFSKPINKNIFTENIKEIFGLQ